MASGIVGVLGSGKFGIAISRLVARNANVLIYTRRPEVAEQINKDHVWNTIGLQANIKATSSIKELCESCDFIMPVIPSEYFRASMRDAQQYLTPQHILLHGTKGFDNQSSITIGKSSESNVTIKTMSQVIMEETNVIRIGAISGPNLADEILSDLPTAAVIASEFDEVVQHGKRALSSENFYVFGSQDIKGAELAGALKNVIALASGMIAGRKLGKNIEAMLIVRGLREMIHIGGLLGSTTEAFFGAAGIGDLIVTSTSDKSRNYSCGVRLAQGDNIEDIIAGSSEAIEGIRTLKLINSFIKANRISAPIFNTVYDIVFENVAIDDRIKRLMKFPLSADVDYI